MTVDLAKLRPPEAEEKDQEMTNNDNTTNPPPDGLPEEWHRLHRIVHGQATAQFEDVTDSVARCLQAHATERKARLEAEAELERERIRLAACGVVALATVQFIAAIAAVNLLAG